MWERHLAVILHGVFLLLDDERQIVFNAARVSGDLRVLSYATWELIVVNPLVNQVLLENALNTMVCSYVAERSPEGRALKRLITKMQVGNVDMFFSHASANGLCSDI